ncbi:Late embryogenesis abundant protein [Trema orientale]|uniref:Late embryogenesis abundant protein n=1 Tax=Trema orientale TaxID=63057 RepID=A0A2P5FHY0_TREOI|nr:Late embryogenesis abundant protein [Trema orientale]
MAEYDPEKQETPDPPPPQDHQKPYHPGRRGAGSKYCGGCLRVLFLVAVAAIVLTGLAITIFCIIMNPHQMKFHVTNASLSRFDYVAANQTLNFKLLLNATIRNPNKRIGIHFEYSTDHYAYYDGEFLGVGGTGLSFYLPPGAVSTAEYGWALFEGSRTVSFDSREVKRFNKRKSDGVFPFYVKVKMTNSFKVDKMHIGDFRSTVKCRLKVPLIRSAANGKTGSSSTRFKDTKCEYFFNPFPIIYTD